MAMNVEIYTKDPNNW